jgi:retinol dehydrogenase-12
VNLAATGHVEPAEHYAIPANLATDPANLAANPADLGADRAARRGDLADPDAERDRRHADPADGEGVASHHGMPSAMNDAGLSGQTFLVTGANTGIGRVTAEVLAKRGAKVILACRSEDKTRPVVQGIRAAGGDAEFVSLDLADLVSVRRCAEDLLARDLPIDGLINNAGLAGLRGQTKQGFELTFGTNHLGHFLLTTLLLPRVRAAKGRIVSVSSKAHYDFKPQSPPSPDVIDWAALRERTRTVTGLAEYSVSKLCNILFTKELARGKAGEGVHAYALHPGVIASDAWRQIPQPFRWFMKLGMLSSEDGAKTTLFCATSPEVAGDNGLYYDACKTKAPSKYAQDPELARKLWQQSEEWVHDAGAA